MIETHAIRLRGPWECQTHDRPSRRVHMPAALGAIFEANYEGRLVCRRRFGCPTCLDHHERVWLVIERSALSGKADINAKRLGYFGAADHVTEFDITSHLRERNELVLNLDIAAPRATDELLFADVRLEIRG